MISKILFSKNTVYFIKIFKMMKGMNTLEKMMFAVVYDVHKILYIQLVRYAILLQSNFILKFHILVNLLKCKTPNHSRGWWGRGEVGTPPSQLQDFLNKCLYDVHDVSKLEIEVCEDIVVANISCRDSFVSHGCYNKTGLKKAQWRTCKPSYRKEIAK